MKDPIKQLLAPQNEDRALDFPSNSRYHGMPIAELTMPTATQSTYDQQSSVEPSRVRYLRRRFVPRPEELATLGEHTVVQGERPDHVAMQELGDSELYWRLCDANGALHPAELTAEVAQRLRVTLPEGVPAPARGEE